jgi:hypothetical protein
MFIMDGADEHAIDGTFEDVPAAVEEATLRIRNDLSRSYIIVDEEHGDLFDHVDVFVNLSRHNQTLENVQKVTLCIPFTDPDDNSRTLRYAMWDKIAEGIGNLEALDEIIIGSQEDHGPEDDEGPLAPDWVILACILRRLRRGVMLSLMHDYAPITWDRESLQVFAGVLHGHAMITGFVTGYGFPFHCLDVLCSTLLTLPALETISFWNDEVQGPEEGQSRESVVQLLQSPTLRRVNFACVSFTYPLCQAVAKALKERSQITKLQFNVGCSFPENGSAVIASALKTNTTLKDLAFIDDGVDEVFCDVLAAALLCNSTLQTLELPPPYSCSWLSPLFLALQANTGLKNLRIRGIETIDEKLSTAMRLGLDKNSTLESLRLSDIKSADNDTSFWREGFSFLRTNTALKCLEMHFENHMTESDAIAIRMEGSAALRENESLETLSMTSKDAMFEDYVAFVVAIQRNTTLKSLQLHHEDICVDNEVMKDLVSVLKKNYGLEEIPGLNHGKGDIRSILQLNRAGRRYIVQDGSSISKGVDVLSRVCNNINSVFLHLLENPRLCDRSAVETASIGNIDNARLTSQGNLHSGGKQRESQVPHHVVQGPARTPFSDKSDISINTAPAAGKGSFKTLN